MKKMLVFLVALTALLSVFVLGGCEERDTGGEVEGAYVAQTLTLNKKYYYSSEMNRAEAQRSYVIFIDGENGQYRPYYKSTEFTTTSIYTISFKYLRIEDTVVCFFDSVTYDPTHNQAQINTTWTATYGFSKDIIMTTSGNIYICESYLPNISNFGK